MNVQDIEKLKAILESVYNAIVAVDDQGIITIFNPAAERITGIPASKAIKRHVSEVIPNTGLLEILETGDYKYSQKIQFGGATAISNRAPIIKDNEIIGAVAVLQDISDLEAVSAELKASKELNKELDDIIDSVYDGLYITDGHGFTTRINSSYTRMTGIKPDEVLGRHMQELVEAGYFSQSVTLIVLEKKEPVTIMHTIKGEKRCLITGNPIFNEKGEITQVVTNVRDMTTLTDLKEKLEQTEELSRRYHLELEHLRKQQMEKSGALGQSLEMEHVLDLAQRAAEVDATVLVLGETGVGKEVIAREIHKKSPRSNGPFIKVNCAAIPENLLESELFGYDRGAFTGASNKGKPGMFELANSGTILLDEIGELPLALQVKLLRVLQEKEVARIGGTQSQDLDVRIIAATNQNLERQIKKGLFREDLFYRLNVIPIVIPPLRHRPEDISLLVKHYLDMFNKRYKKDRKLSTEALEVLKHYSWPGNIRELKNLIERLVIMINEDTITPNHLRELQDDRTSEMNFLHDAQPKLEEAVFSVEKQLIIRALKDYGSTRKAAKVLGVSQSTVVRKAKKHGITINE